MSMRTKREATPRQPVTRQRILRAAIALADRSGIDAVTMRRVAQKLRIEAMSLYHHVADKEDMLDGMVDLIYTEIEVPVEDDWKSALRHRALSARRVLRRHRWALGLLDSRTTPAPATLRHHDQVIGLLRSANFSLLMAARAFALMDSYIYGFVIQELSLTFTNAEELADVAETILHDVPDDSYPNLAALTRAYVDTSAYDADGDFAFGLDLILDGLAQPTRA